MSELGADFPALVKRVREHLKLSQEDLVHELGVSFSTANRWENRPEQFLLNLKRVNDEEDWGITYSAEGKILVNANDIDTVLRVLNNDRLTSKIDEENFDVDVKHKPGSSD